MSGLSSDSTDSPLDGVTVQASGRETQICAPGKVVCWRTSATTAVLSWDEPYSTCDLCPDAAGYEVAGDGIAPINVIRPPCELSGLKADVEYVLEIYAKAGDIRSRPSRMRLGISPRAPGKLQVHMLTATSASLSWSAPTRGAPVFDYVIECGETLVTTVRGLDCVVTELPNVLSPVFAVRARTNSRNLSDSASARPPDPPVNLEVAATTARSVTFAWDPPARAGVTGYKVSINGQVVATVTKPGYEAVSPQGEYFTFAVASQDANGNVSLKNARSTPNPDREPPARPPGLKLLFSSYTSVTLGWDASTDNHAVAGYRFFSPDGTQTDLVENCFTINGLQTGVVYCCAVRAFDGAGNLSEVSAIDVSPADKVAPTMPTRLKVTDDRITTFTIVWDASQDNVGVRGYNVSLSTPNGGSVLTDTTDRTTYTLRNKLTRDQAYLFKVAAFDAAGNVSSAAGILVSTPHFANIVLRNHSILIPGGSKEFYLRLIDGFGLPIEGQDITWHSSSILQLDTLSGKTDSSGLLRNKATVSATLSPYLERYSISAISNSRPLATGYFDTPGISVSNNWPPYFSTVTLNLLVADEHGRPLPEAVVEWGSNLYVSLSQTRTTTNHLGKSSITATHTRSHHVFNSGYFTATVNGIRYRSEGVWFGAPGKP